MESAQYEVWDRGPLNFMNILAFDGATEHCSVALSAEDSVITRSKLAPKKHTELLLPMADDLLNEAGFNFTDLEALAWIQGPGSFTGLRLTSAIVQALSMAHELPVLGVSLLQRLAQTAYEQHGVEQVTVCLDARRGNLYQGDFILRDGVMQGSETLKAISESNPYQMSSMLVGDVHALPKEWIVDKKILEGEWHDPNTLLFLAARHHTTEEHSMNLDGLPNYLSDYIPKGSQDATRRSRSGVYKSVHEP